MLSDAIKSPTKLATLKSGGTRSILMEKDEQADGNRYATQKKIRNINQSRSHSLVVDVQYNRDLLSKQQKLST